MNKIRVKTTYKALKRKGMGLVEVVIAIGISVVTMTGAAVLSTSLVRRSQENFIEISVNQAQSLIVEQLRLTELGLKQDKAQGKAYEDATTFLNEVSSPAEQITWSKFCDDATDYYRLSLPVFNSKNSVPVNHKIRYRNDLFVKPGTDGDKYGVLEGVQFGAYTKTNTTPMVEVSIKKTTTQAAFNSSSKIIKFTVTLVYKVFDKEQFTKPQEVSMIKDLICK